MTNTFELILNTESKVLSTNINTFEEQANQYLLTLTNTFETDDDFAKAKEEVKELKEIETKIRTAIDNVTKGNADISTLLTTAENIAERFRQERLEREKLVKTKEVEIKDTIVKTAYETILKIRQGFESDISLALERNISKLSIEKRLNEATKRRSTLATLTKAVNAEAEAIKAEIATESARISARRKLIPISHEYLFKDCIALIAGNDELEAIVKQRIDEEMQREAEIKAKAAQEAKEKAEREAQQAKAMEKTQEETIATAEIAQPQTVSSSQEFTEATPSEPLADFVITIRLNQVTQQHAVSLARRLKAQFGDSVSLNKTK